MYEPEKGDPMTPCMSIYRANNKSDEMIGYTWAITASMSTLKYVLADDSMHK